MQPVPHCAVSVIIVSWNVRELLLRCLASVRANTDRADYEIVVVDNGSSDGTGEAVRAAFPGVRLIESGKNLGFPGGCNLGADNSSGQYLFFLNPDTELRAGALDRLAGFLDANPGALAAGAKLLWPDGSYQDSYRRFPGLLYSILEVFEFHYYFPGNRFCRGSLYDLQVFEEPTEVDWLVGAAFMVRRAAFKKIGGFDENIFMYTEDTDLCRRIADPRGGVYFIPGAEVVHYKGRSSRQSNVRAVDYYRSFYYYHRKHSGLPHALLYRASVALWSLACLPVLALKFLFGVDRDVRAEKVRARYSLLKWSVLKWK